MAAEACRRSETGSRQGQIPMDCVQSSRIGLKARRTLDKTLAQSLMWLYVAQ